MFQCRVLPKHYLAVFKRTGIERLKTSWSVARQGMIRGRPRMQAQQTQLLLLTSATAALLTPNLRRDYDTDSGLKSHIPSHLSLLWRHLADGIRDAFESFKL